MQTGINQYNERVGQRKRILKLLNENLFVPTAQMRLVAYQYNARIHELRKEGYQIRSIRTPKCGFELIGRVMN